MARRLNQERKSVGSNFEETITRREKSLTSACGAICITQTGRGVWMKRMCAWLADGPIDTERLIRKAPPSIYALAVSGPARREALPAARPVECGTCSAESHQRRWPSCLIFRDCGTEEKRRMPNRCQYRRSPYKNNLIEQDHRFIKTRVVTSQWFRSAEGALQTVQGYEAIHMLRKGQIQWVRRGDIAGQIRFVNRLFDLAA